MGHVLARLAGYGIALTPHWPYMFERHQADSDAVRVTRWTPSGPAQVVIKPHQLTDGRDVVDVAAGPSRPCWFVETSTFRLRWPTQFTVESAQDQSDGTPFYLHGPGEAIIFPQGPVAKERLVDPHALVAAGQKVLDQHVADDGSRLIELGYEHNEEPCWQGHWTIPYDSDRVLVLTAQALLAHSTQTREAAEVIAASFERCQ
ncbi:hypothetical protein JOD64_000758 [Micromonospora luteifusca]|uniref:DUF317 domain-containing protein n=1 Tax=Micromonospora luteifusca TaxID=709860 RepID=A0ABS2LMW9_9ACTN|nr:hypothetical protein [Micromonospora luteifusca]MBM7489536.1 hypothetical protein [Micromonospora luteifusca]